MNKPATPLPWANIGTRISARADSIGSTEQALDAAYIVHAANAYPKLVAALREAADNLAYRGGNERAEAYRSILRELGEL